MKKQLAAISLSFFVASGLFASDDSSITQKLQQMQSQMDQMQSENAQLRSEVSSIKQANTDGMKKEAGAINNRLDELETSVLQNKINFGLDFQSRMNDFAGQYAGQQGNMMNPSAGGKYYNPNSWNSKLSLDMNAKITDDLKFTGRLSSFYYWGSNNTNPQTGGSYFAARDGNQPTNSALYVERAYVDWTVNNDLGMSNYVPVTFTIGRQPSTDGPSKQFQNNTVRKSTYSALAFDGIADGIVETTNLSKATGIDGTALRFGYAKAYQYFNSNPGSPNMYAGGPTQGTPDTNVFGIFLDSTIPTVKGSLIQVAAVGAQNVSYGPNYGANGAVNLGSINMYGGTAEFTNLEDTGLDLFAHYYISQAKPTGNGIQLQQGMPYYYSMLSDGYSATGNPTNTKTGSALWLGARYDIPMIKGKIGAEYNQGSQYWCNFTQGTSDPLNKLAARGKAFEVYYIQALNRYAFLKLGATRIVYGYTGSGNFAGPDVSINNAAAGATGSLSSINNYYLTFNVRY